MREACVYFILIEAVGLGESNDGGLAKQAKELLSKSAAAPAATGLGVEAKLQEMQASASNVRSIDVNSWTMDNFAAEKVRLESAIVDLEGHTQEFSLYIDALKDSGCNCILSSPEGDFGHHHSQIP